MTNWNMYTDDDGKEWLEVSGQVMVRDYEPPVPIWQKSTDQSGSILVPLTSAPYALESVSRLRGQGFGLDASKITTGTFGDTGLIDSLQVPTTRLWTSDWTEIRGGEIRSGRPQRKPPEQPSGRFQNLDWEEAS